VRAAHENHVAMSEMQQQHEQAAARDTTMRASYNHGRPSVAATAKAGVFYGKGVVAARTAAPAAHELAHAAGQPPGHGNPGAAQPGAHGNPGAAQPGAHGNPGAAQPGAHGPGAAQPGAHGPGAAQPPPHVNSPAGHGYPAAPPHGAPGTAHPQQERGGEHPEHGGGHPG
jgi:hypothetical protein